MKTRTIPSSNIPLTELSFGGAIVGNLFQSISNQQAEETLHAAWNNGIRYFDTAPYYGYGLSERRIGDALRAYPRTQYIISTKVGRILEPNATPKNADPFIDALPFHPKYDYTYDGIMRSFEHSLQRMGTDYLDIIFIHDIGHYTHGDNNVIYMQQLLDSGYRALSDLKSQKVLHAIGLGVNEWEICVELMPKINLDCVLLAGRYTLLEQLSLTHFFPQCKKYNVAVIAASPFNSGILAGGTTYNYAHADQLIAAKVKALQLICTEYNIHLAQAALQFPLLHPQVTSVLTGFKAQEETLFAAQALKKSIPTEFWNKLKEKKFLDINTPVG